MRGRLDAYISSIPDCHTAFGVEIRSHRKCWQDHVRNVQPLTAESSPHLQQVSLRQAQVIFLELADQVIYKDHGHRSNAKSSYVKEIMIREFGDCIAFYERTQQNLSDIVYENKLLEHMFFRNQ